MEERNWTWKTDGTLTGQHPVILGEPNYFDDGSPRQIAELETTRYRDNSTKRWKRKENADEIERIADMLTAAPETLDALKRLVYATENRDCPREFVAAIENARAAIAKATGEQP